MGADRPVASISSARVNAARPVHGHLQHALEVQPPQVRGVARPAVDSVRSDAERSWSDIFGKESKKVTALGNAYPGVGSRK